MLRSRTLIATACVCAAIAASASTVFAVDRQSLSGSICHIEYGGTWGFRISDMSYMSTDQSHYVVCPIDRDDPKNTDGLSDLEIHAGQAQFVTGSNCTARSVARAGGGVARSVTRNLPTFNPPSDKIDYGSALNASYDWGMYTLECDLRARNNANQGYGAFISQIIVLEGA